MNKVFDSHFHIIDPRFPLVADSGFLPQEFLCAHYQAHAKQLNIVGGAVVSGSFQAFDQTYLAAALQTLGPSFVGVTQLPASTTDAEILELHQAGVRALRFNLRRGGSASVEELELLARRVYETAGWHVELYVDSRELAELFDRLVGLPAVSVDHLGLSRSGFPLLIQLVERGVYVKVSGFGRIDFDPRQALDDLASVNADALLFGTDLPSTRARRPFRNQDLDLVVEVLGSEIAEKVLYRNAVSLYRPRNIP